MAERKTSLLANSLAGLGGISVLRQLGLLVGLAASVALGVAIVMWAQKPSYRLLYNGLSDKDTAAITSSLQGSGIPYEVNADTGMIMVPADRVHDARLKLAGQGLPKGTTQGFDLLDKEQGFGTSQFMENARYQRALEGELSQTIGSLANVQGARVHLAMPRQTAFLRDREKKQVSASVMINLAPGRDLEPGQVAAIVHLVASSVPNLDPDAVTVVDQKGKLLTSSGSDRDLQLSASQFDYKKKVEEYYVGRIEDLLRPLTGAGKVSAQVSADLDFSVTEQTQEMYNPDMPAVRSEQTFEESTSGPAGGGGVPGALTNQPPAAGTVGQPPAAAAGVETSGPQNSTRRMTRNYELDRTISHTRLGGAAVQRLSVAVVVDDREITSEEGEVTRKPLTAQELERITTLVKQAVGFDAQRGDSVDVINASFTPPPPAEKAPEPSFLDKPGVMDVVKQVAGGVIALLLALLVLKPVMRSLAEKGKIVHASLPPPPPELPADHLSLAGPQQMAQLPGPNMHEQQLNMAKSMAAQDPKRVAQVVKSWVGSDG